MPTPANSQNTPPLPASVLDDWEDFVKGRYPAPLSATSAPAKKADEFRNYEAEARPSVREFYRLNHLNQTYAFVQAKRADYLRLERRTMTIWEAMEYLNNLVDDSDPDTDFTQIEHLMQTAEQIRRDGHPRWFILTGLIHDLGKILCLFGEPQWAVVGDTFPVGCRPSPKIVFPEFFAENPDRKDLRFAGPLGVYAENCGLQNVFLSWGHDEYLYNVVKEYLPEPALYMIRYHSFYPWHREGDYDYLTDARDREMRKWVEAFNPYDLYTKSHARPNVKELRPYYEELIAEFFPRPLRW